MNKVLKRRWIEALRSGKYKQGRNSLNEYGKFCCLGVLCHIQDPKRELWDGVASTPPPALRGGLDDEYNGHMDLLIQANDDEGWNFNQIADYIEVML